MAVKGVRTFALFVAVLVIFKTGHCYYADKTLKATTSAKTQSSSSFTNHRSTTYYISPDPSYNLIINSYYLEITWSSSFDIKGNMPYCTGAYVQVFLTSSYRDVGVFCSLNAGKPFSMYSKDGHAKIIFSTDGSTSGSTFTFYYKLKLKSNYIGGNPTSSSCLNAYNYASSGVIFSSGWPAGYKDSPDDCGHLIIRGSSYYKTKVVFMDIDTNPSYSSYSGHDSVRLYGSSYAYDYERYLIAKMYSTGSRLDSFSRTYKYMKIVFDRTEGSKSTYSGFVAGYIQYKRETKTTHTTRVAFPSYLTPIIIIIILFIALSFYTKIRRQRANARRNNNVVNVGTTITASSTQQTVTAIPSTTPVYPPAQPCGEAPYPTSYPTSYDASTLSTIPPPHYTAAVSSADNPTPIGTMPPPYQAVQPPSGMPQPGQEGLPYPPMISTQYPPPADFPPPNQPPPNLPPPSYDMAIQK